MKGLETLASIRAGNRRRGRERDGKPLLHKSGNLWRQGEQ